MIIWSLLGLALVAIVNNMVRNRRIKHHNRNVDRHNELIEKLQQQKENNKENEH
jgi:hypothetical protein